MNLGFLNSCIPTSRGSIMYHSVTLHVSRDNNTSLIVSMIRAIDPITFLQININCWWLLHQVPMVPRGSNTTPQEGAIIGQCRGAYLHDNGQTTPTLRNTTRPLVPQRFAHMFAFSTKCAQFNKTKSGIHFKG